jgi:hypothetical protein
MAIGGGGGQREIARKNGPGGGSCPRSGSFPGGGPGARRMTAARRVGVELTGAAADSPMPGMPAGRVRLPPACGSNTTPEHARRVRSTFRFRFSTQAPQMSASIFVWPQ